MATAKEKREARDQELRNEGARSAIEALNKESTIHPDKVPDAHGEVAKPAVAGVKVIVACKLGVSYFDIQLCEIVDKFEQNMQGGREVREAIRVGQVVRLRGTAYPRGTPPKGFPAPPEIVDGAALNYGIDKDWFDQWLKQNKLNPIVINKMVFAHEKLDGVRGMAAENKETRSGLEPITPGNDPRIVKSTRSEVSDVEAGVR